MVFSVWQNFKPLWQLFIELNSPILKKLLNNFVTLFAVAAMAFLFDRHLLDFAMIKIYLNWPKFGYIKLVYLNYKNTSISLCSQTFKAIWVLQLFRRMVQFDSRLWKRPKLHQSNSCLRSSLKSPFAVCQLIRIACKLIEEEDTLATETGPYFDFVESWYIIFMKYNNSKDIFVTKYTF